MDGSRKRLVFLSLAAVVAVIAGAIAIWSPGHSPSDASGAIGAVEKHRSVQIGAQDVILADESVMAESKIVFADYLNDAATLQNIGADLAAMSVYNRDTLGAANAALENHSTELQSRYASHMSDTLNAVQAMVESRGGGNLGAAVAELNNIEASLAAKPNLEQMEALYSRLNSAVSELQAKGELSAAPALFAKLENELAAAAELAHKDSLQAAAQLGQIAGQLDNKAFLGASLQAQMGYLNAMVVEAKMIENVQSELNAAMQLESKGAALDSRLNAAVTELGNHAAQLESHAAENLQSRLNAHVELNSRLNNMQAMLGAQLQNKASLGAQALQNVEQALGAVSQGLESMNAALGSRLTGNMTVELQAIGQHLGAIDALQSRLNLGSQSLESKGAGNLQAAAALESKVSLGSKVNLGAAASLFNREALGSFQSYLQQAASLDSKLLGNVALANKATELQNRSGELAAAVSVE